MGAVRARRAVAGHRVGRWVLDHQLGAATWSAADPFGARVVVRLGAPGTPAAAAVRAEASALAAFGPRHLPGLPRPAGEVAAPGIVAVATELVPGATLACLLAEGRLPAWPDVAALLSPVAEALAAMHEAGWVHGDVAPANVVAGPVGGVLVDLGCAAPTRNARATGTPGAVAPEVEAGAPVTPAAEVWALAAVAASLVAGGSARATLALRRALADEPGTRPTAAELATLLRLAVPAAPDDPRTAVTRDYGPRPPRAEPAGRTRRRTIPGSIAALVRR